MNLHLEAIGQKVTPGAHAILVFDGAGYHKPAALTFPDNISPLILPPYSPELNPVENVWEYLRQNKLSLSVFDTYDAIVTACCNAWNAFANAPDRIASITTPDWASQIIV
jgi:transposase